MAKKHKLVRFEVREVKNGLVVENYTDGYDDQTTVVCNTPQEVLAVVEQILNKSLKKGWF